MVTVSIGVVFGPVLICLLALPVYFFVLGKEHCGKLVYICLIGILINILNACFREIPDAHMNLVSGVI